MLEEDRISFPLTFVRVIGTNRPHLERREGQRFVVLYRNVFSYPTVCCPWTQHLDIVSIRTVHSQRETLEVNFNGPLAFMTNCHCTCHALVDIKRIATLQGCEASPLRTHSRDVTKSVGVHLGPYCGR